MIPICRDPKRFVAALNKERYVACTKRFLTRDISNPVIRRHAVVALTSTSKLTAPHAFAAAHVKPFSTAKLQVDEIKSATINVITTENVTYKDSMNLVGPRDSAWWTGKKPQECPGYIPSTGKLHSLPQLNLDSKTCTRQTLQNYFDNTWTLTEVLLASLQGEEAFMRSPYHDLRHPMIFYYGHPAALYVNKLRVAGLLKDPINAYYESIFETGVDEMSWDDLSKNKMPWPSVAEVREYRKVVYRTVSNLISNLTDSQCASINQQSPLWALIMGFEHERIHLETSSVLINELPIRFVRFPEGFPHYHPSVPSKDNGVRKPVAGVHYPMNEMIDVPAQKVSIGKPRDFPSYGWDNEYGYREYDVPAFRASKFKISNGEFWEFVKDNGYARRELWNEVGWKWRAFRNVKWPTFWMRVGPQGNHEYDMRLIFDVRPMAWNWPVCVNYHEAVAFAQWKSLKTGKYYRILTEVEHRAIRDPVVSGNRVHNDHVMNFAGNDMEKVGVNTNLAYSSFSPVDAYPVNSKGFTDTFGSAWEWTPDSFCPLPGFEIHPYYEDFSTPCFDGLHNVIMGGSFISTGNEASVHSRFHFRPHFYQHASFRLVEQLGPEMVTSDTDAPGPYVGNYPFRRSAGKMLELANKSTAHSDEVKFNDLLSLHFGQLQGVFSSVLNSSTRNSFTTLKNQIVDVANSLGLKLSDANALEVGCGPGGLTFQLAQHVQSVIGVDHHSEAVNFAKGLIGSSEPPKFSLQEEGSLQSNQDIAQPLGIVSKQIEFRCADPMCLPAEMKGFDLVVLNDVLDKVSAPNSILGRLGGVRGLVRPGGLLVVVSAFNWDEQRTPKALWLGGFKTADGTTVKSEDTMIDRLSSDFKIQKSMQIPFLWHESMGEIRGKNFTVTMFTRK